jgi:hypothetical protein
MTKTNSAVGPNSFGNTVQPVVLPFGTNADGSLVWNFPFGLAQGGESFDFAQDRESVERLVEPFGIWCL